MNKVLYKWIVDRTCQSADASDMIMRLPETSTFIFDLILHRYNDQSISRIQ